MGAGRILFRGLYVLGTDFKMKAVDLGEVQETDFTAPLPVLGLRGSFAVTPQWFIRQSFDYFYINYGDYEGQLVDFNVAVEWDFWKYAGVGVGYNYVQMDLDYDGSDDFLSGINLSYGGVLLFGKRMGLERTDLTFVALSGLGPKSPNEVVRYDLLDTSGVNTVLELRVEEGGLRGRYTISPPSSAYLKMRARLIVKSDNEILLEDTVFCAGQKRDFREWSENDGQLFFDALISCIPDLTAKVIGDFFLVFPTNTE